MFDFHHLTRTSKNFFFKCVSAGVDLPSGCICLALPDSAFCWEHI